MKNTTQATTAVLAIHSGHDRNTAAQTKVLILAEASGREGSWTRGIPCPLLPLATSSILETLLERFESMKKTDFVICANGLTDRIAAHLDWSVKEECGRARPPFQFHRNALPRGSAGYVKDATKDWNGESVLIVSGALWLEDDPASLIEQHRASKNALTIFSITGAGEPQGDESVTTKPITLYCCSPVVFEHVSDRGRQDIREHLIPALQRSGLKVGTVTLRSETREVNDWATYLHAVTRSMASQDLRECGYSLRTQDVWCGPDTWIAPEARITGPVLMGRGCRIEGGAVVVGPAILGNYAVIETDARLVRTIAPSGVKVAARAVTTDCLAIPVTQQATVGRPAAHGGAASLTTNRSEVVLPPTISFKKALNGRGLAGVIGLTLLGLTIWASAPILQNLWRTWFNN